MRDYSEIAAALTRGAANHPELEQTIKLYLNLLDIQESANINPAVPALTAGEARERLGRGQPLLVPEELEIDAGVLADLCARIGFKIAEHRRDRVKDLARIHAWLYERRDRVKVLAVDYLRNGRVRNGDGAAVDQAMLTFVFSMALRPFLRAHASALASLIDDSQWYRGHCPVCGGEPDMAALEKGGGRRILLCSRCDYEWVFRRLGCPFCGNQEPARLSYYPSDDKVYRLAVCEDCKRYLKTIDLRETAEEKVLPAERVLTAGLDAAAEQAGYKGGEW